MIEIEFHLSYYIPHEPQHMKNASNYAKSSPQVIKLFILNSAEQEIYPAHIRGLVKNN